MSKFISKGLITGRHVNPLNPDYNLPSIPPRYPQVENRFLHENINVNDIDGAQPRHLHPYDQRDNMNSYSQHIPSNKPKPRYVRSTHFDNINYRDVTNPHSFISNRCSNPLDPQYDVRYYGGENYFYGDIEGSKPASFSPYSNDYNYSLNHHDIIGSQPGTKNRFSRFSYDNTLSLSGNDIIGTKPNSKAKGIVTGRQTNPLNPDYQYLGENEDKNYYQGVFNEYGNKLRMNYHPRERKIYEPLSRRLSQQHNCFSIISTAPTHSKREEGHYPHNNTYDNVYSQTDNHKGSYFVNRMSDNSNRNAYWNNYQSEAETGEHRLISFGRRKNPDLFPAWTNNKIVKLKGNIMDYANKKINKQAYS